MNKKSKRTFNIVMIIIPIVAMIAMFAYVTYSDFLIKGEYYYNISCLIRSMVYLKWLPLILMIPLSFLQYLISVKCYSNFLKKGLTIFNVLSLCLIYKLMISTAAAYLVPNTGGGIDDKYFGLSFYILYLYLIPIGVILLGIIIGLLVRMIYLNIKNQSTQFDKTYMKSFLIAILTLLIINIGVNAYYWCEKEVVYQQVAHKLDTDEPVVKKMGYVFDKVENLHLDQFDIQCENYGFCPMFYHKVNTFELKDTKLDFQSVSVEKYDHKLKYIFEYKSFKYHTIIVDEHDKIIEINYPHMNKKEAKQLLAKVNKELFKQVKTAIK